MTAIQINASDCTICKWILWLEATKLLQMILTERNNSIPLIRLLSFHFQHCQACSFVLGFIPLIGEPACLLPQLVHAHCSQAPRLARQPGLEWLPVWAGLKSWSGLVSWGDGSNANGNSTQVKSDSLVLTFLTKRCLYLVLTWKQQLHIQYIWWSIDCWLCEAYVVPFDAPNYCVGSDVAVYVYAEKRLPPGSWGTVLDHLITVALRQGHDRRDYNLHFCTTPFP